MEKMTNKRTDITARSSTSSGKDTPTAERRKARAVPSGTPLVTKASSRGTVHAPVPAKRFSKNPPGTNPWSPAPNPSDKSSQGAIFRNINRLVSAASMMRARQPWGGVSVSSSGGATAPGTSQRSARKNVRTIPPLIPSVIPAIV